MNLRRVYLRGRSEGITILFRKVVLIKLKESLQPYARFPITYSFHSFLIVNYTVAAGLRDTATLT